MLVEVLPYGANIRRLLVPDAVGHVVNVVIGYSDPSMYLTERCIMGGAIGPICSRTEDASFVLDGVTYHLPQNDGKHNLHSDMYNGFHKREWNVKYADEAKIELTIHLPHLDLGIPGNRDVSLSYSLTDDNELFTDYRITSDCVTYVNPTLHPYFNLDGAHGSTILNHVVKFRASRFLPYRKETVPSGEIRKVLNTPFDFTQEKEIGRDIDEPDDQLSIGNGYDHHFIIDDTDGAPSPFATVSSVISGIVMEVSTTLPGFTFYAGNDFSCIEDCSGRKRGKREAFCIEPCFPPNVINTPSFQQPVCEESQPFLSSTIYRFANV